MQGSEEEWNVTSRRTARVQEGERNSRRDVRPETDGREQTGGTGQYGSGFVDLEKAFDTVPGEMVMAALRWMGVPEAEVRMAEGTYEKTTARVVVGEGASGEFEVNIGLEAGQRAEPPAVHSSTEPHQQEDGGKGYQEETPRCRRPGPGGEWMANRGNRRRWRSGTGCLPDTG